MLDFDVLVERGCIVTKIDDKITEITNNDSIIQLRYSFWALLNISIKKIDDPNDISDIIVWLELKPFTYGLSPLIDTYVKQLYPITPGQAPVIYDGESYKSVYDTKYIAIVYDKLDNIYNETKIVNICRQSRLRESDIPDHIEVICVFRDLSVEFLRGGPGRTIAYDGYRQWLIDFVTNDIVEIRSNSKSARK